MFRRVLSSTFIKRKYINTLHINRYHDEHYEKIYRNENNDIDVNEKEIVRIDRVETIVPYPWIASSGISNAELDIMIKNCSKVDNTNPSKMDKKLC